LETTQNTLDVMGHLGM